MITSTLCRAAVVVGATAFGDVDGLGEENRQALDVDHELVISVIDPAGRILADAGIEVRNADGSTYKAMILTDGRHFASPVSGKVALTISPMGLPDSYVEFMLTHTQKQAEVTVFIDDEGHATFAARPFVTLDDHSLAPFGGGNAGGQRDGGGEVVCDGSETPEGEPVCGPDYVDNVNGGLNSSPPVYSPIACFEQVCGTTGNFLNGGVQTRDTDWYLITLGAETDVTWTATADGFAHTITTMDISVPGGAVVGDSVVSVAGETLSVTNCLAPGDWALFVSTAGFVGVPCNSQYQAGVTCEDCLPPAFGACCNPDGSCTDEANEAACASLGGSFQGEGTSCADPDICPQPMPCTGDFDQSGDVGFADLLILLGRWGPCPGCIQDLNGSGDVGFADLLIVLGVWGPCPGPTGACCLITDACVEATASACAAQGGIYRGDGTDCGTSFCEPDCNGNGIPDPQDIAGGAPDCNLDQIPDECQDCDGNGIADSCEIEAGAPDCNGNGIPDDCESDCDGNGIPDDCDIAAGAPDCNGNGTPDQCDLDSLESLDCNGNGIPDECDIADGTSTDLDGNEVPDECGPDCNMNGIDDRVEVEVLGAPDCNANGIPDECELDCNGSGLPDDCDILLGLSLDCNGNGSPDECDIASGASLDFSPPNGVPDECEPASSCVSPCDFWYTVNPTEIDPLPSFQDFVDQPIPADWFCPGPGFEPFTGTVCLGGRPLDPQLFGETDTIIHRSADPFQISDPPSPVPSVVDIQITALSLTSCEPITVQAGTETCEWNVEVHLSDVAPSNGQLTAVKTHPNGGFFDSVIFVQPKFVFRRVGALSDVRILDTGVEGIPPTPLRSFGTPWVHILNPELVLVHDPGSSFVPGVEEDPGTGEQVFPPVPEESDTGNEVHLVRAPCVLVVDLDIWNGLDGACNGAVNGPCGGQVVPDAVEESLGAVTVANKNDTDGDGTVDKDDNDVSVAGANPPGRNEVDLMKIVLRKPVPDMGGAVTLSKLGGDIKVWEQSTKVTEVVLPAMYPTNMLPKPLWVEAREPSPMLRDIGLEMTYMGKRDEVRATGAWSFRTLAKLTRAVAGAANAIPADCGANASTIIGTYAAADGSRYGPGNFGPVNGAGADTRIGGRILLEFMTLPNGVEGLGVRWDITRRIRYRDFRIVDGTAMLTPNGMKNFPTENETPNDDNHADDEDNTPANQHIYSFDGPSYPRGAGEAFVITRNTFKEYTRVRIHRNGVFTNMNLKLEGSRSSLKEDWHEIDYLVRSSSGHRVPDTMQPSASFPLRAGAGTGTIAVAVFGGAVTEGFTVTYDLAMKKWTLTGTSGDMTMTAVAGAVPAGTQWVLTLGTKIKVTITQGATAFGNGASFTFSTFKSSAAGGKQNVINLGAIDPTSGP